MEPTRPRHSMPNSLALWLPWVCRDLQVSDVLARRLAVVGKTTAWTGAHAGSMPTKSHTPPVSGSAALTALDASKRCRTGSRGCTLTRQIQDLWLEDPLG
jgi:hypothetical protein